MTDSVQTLTENILQGHGAECRLERAVAQVRSRGWATAPNQVLHGVNGLAAPVFNHAGSYVGAVAIAGSIQYIPASPPQDQIKAVAQTADRISRKLGWIAR
jgi:DNA-binding IclR family transcriptional regulator